MNTDEIWGIVPPEEKLEMLAKANSYGLMAMVVFTAVISSIAIGLDLKWLMWTGLLSAPLVFQIFTSKGWRAQKPRALLEYLAARSVVRRFAFILKSHELGVLMIFRGHASEDRQGDKLEQAIAAMEKATGQATMWIGLAEQAVIAMLEGPGGARLVFGALIDDTIKIESSSDDGKEYSQTKVVYITKPTKFGGSVRYKFESRYPAAINAFEKKLLMIQHQYIERKKLKALEPLVLDEDDPLGLGLGSNSGPSSGDPLFQ